MKISPAWLREFVDLQVDNRRLAADLTSVGAGVEGIIGDGDSTVFEMEITTNRPDEMNHYGLAREASTIYDLPLKPIRAKLPPVAKAASSSDSGGTAEAVPFPNTGARTQAEALPLPKAAVRLQTEPFPIEIQEPDLCPRFSARALRNVTIKQSPAKVAERLALLDQRPINNAVDATNYVLWEIGKPTHVFDMDLLEGGKIIVRKARAGETLKTLDGLERKLTPDDLVVADARKPVGLAGVMGGFDTMITEKTKNILIESAWWDPATVRKVSRRHGLHTDASHRFERGADFESTVLSCDLVAEMILASGGGERVGDVVDVIAKQIDQAPIALHMSDVRRILGEGLSTAQVLDILRKLGFDATPERTDASEFTVHVPSWRLDVSRQIDLIEEIARVHGYDKFPNTLPAYAGAVVEKPEARKDAKLRSSLLGLGYNEAISLVFISHEDAKKFSAAEAVELANPQSEEASVMRTSAIPGMLNMIAYNLNRGIDNVRLFEAGNVYEYANNRSIEKKRLSLGATGTVLEASVNQSARAYTLFDMKGDIETLLSHFEHGSLVYDTDTPDYYHPGRSARAVMDGEVVAYFGQLHPDVQNEHRLRQDVYIAEVYPDRLYNHELYEPIYEALPRYPAVQRDFSFLFEDSVWFEKIENTVTELSIRELRSFVPVEIFRGGSVPAGKYSLLLRAVFQSNERTLREDEVAQWSTQIIRALEQLGGSQRA
jgi:phenylalanyl-tRNA synthetase beta chain